MRLALQANLWLTTMALSWRPIKIRAQSIYGEQDEQHRYVLNTLSFRPHINPYSSCYWLKHQKWCCHHQWCDTLTFDFLIKFMCGHCINCWHRLWEWQLVGQVVVLKDKRPTHGEHSIEKHLRCWCRCIQHPAEPAKESGKPTCEPPADHSAQPTDQPPTKSTRNSN